MRPEPAPTRRGQSAIALLAGLALWLQILLPAIGTTAHLVRAGQHHGGNPESIDHARHRGTPAPSRPEQGGHHGSPWGLCCIIGGGKLGTGFAPPPSAPVISTVESRVATVAQALEQAVPPVARRSILPVGARAPPRFA